MLVNLEGRGAIVSSSGDGIIMNDKNNVRSCLIGELYIYAMYLE